MKQLLIMFALMLLSLTACEVKDTVDVPVPPSKLVINCISYGYHPWEAHISASTGILSPGQFPLVTNATINIYEDNLFKETLTVDSYNSPDSYNGVRYLGTTTPKPGKNYKVTVEDQGYEKIESEFRQPDSVKIESVKFQVLGPNTTYTNMTDIQFRVGFNDPPGVDFYEITAIGFVDTTYFNNTQQLKFSFVDPAYAENNDLFYQTLAFDDSYFDGKLVELDFISQIFTRADDEQFKYYTVYLRHLSKEYYLYMKSTNLQLKAANDAFAQPVLIESNITNGYGIFGGFTQTKVTIGR